jgi:hypothetical protein
MSLRQRQHATQALDKTIQAEQEALAKQDEASPPIPGYVIRKLLAFTAALVITPIIAYFASVNTLFAGNSTKAASLAAILANVVLFTYVFVVVRDDLSEQEEGDKEKKKEM